MAGQTFTLAAVGDGQVPHRGVEERGQPGGEDEAGEFAEEVAEGFLEDVEGVFGVPGEATGQAVDPVAVAVIESVKGGGVAVVEIGDEGLVGAGIGWG